MSSNIYKSYILNKALFIFVNITFICLQIYIKDYILNEALFIFFNITFICLYCLKVANELKILSLVCCLNTYGFSHMGNPLFLTSKFSRSNPIYCAGRNMVVFDFILGNYRLTELQVFK